MAKRVDKPQNPHFWPYLVACIIAFGVPIVGVLAYVIIDGFAERAFEDNIFIMAMAMIPLWWALDFVLASPRTHRALPVLSSTTLQERLSRSLFFGVFGSLMLLETVTGVWAIATQFIGGVVIVTCVMVAMDLILDKIWAVLKRMWTNT